MSAAVAGPSSIAHVEGAETHLPAPPVEPAPNRPAPPSAAERFARAIEIRVRMFGEDDASVGEMCNTIALRLKDEQKLDEAMPYFERAVRIREAALGPNDAETLLSRGNLAEALVERALQAPTTPGPGVSTPAATAAASKKQQKVEPTKQQKAEKPKKKKKAATEGKQAGTGSNSEGAKQPQKAKQPSAEERRAAELRDALDMLRDVRSKQTATLGATNPYTLYTRANEWWALAQQPRAVPADFAGAHAQLLEIRAAQVVAHGDGELSPYVQRTDGHLESVLSARAAWMRKHPVYSVKQLEEMNVKDVVKIACKLLRKKEADLRKMGAGLSITQDELVELVMNSPQQVADRELLNAAPTAPVSPVRRPLSARKPAPPVGAAPSDSPRHTPRGGATPSRSALKVDAWVSPSRSELRVREASRRRLAVTALECRDLPKADLLGQNDVYLELSLDDGKVVHTSVVEDGGATPVWGAGGGETVLLVPSSATGRDSATVRGPNLNLPQKLQVDVMDKDVKGSDFIGRHTVELAEMAEKEGGSFDEDWCGEGWFELKDHKGGAAGKVRLVLRWAVPTPTPRLPSDESESAGESLLQHVRHGMHTHTRARAHTHVHARTHTHTRARARAHRHDDVGASPGVAVSSAYEEDLPQWELRTTILECAGLAKMDRFGKNDVYATVAVEGVQSLRTSTAEDAGEAPVWKDGDGLLAHTLHAAPAALGICVFDEDIGSADDLIGTAVVPLGPSLHYSDGATRSKGAFLSSHQHSTKVEWEMPPTWFELTAPNAKHKGKSVGRVRVQIVWQLASKGPSGKNTRPWTPEQAHFWATDTSRLFEEVDSFLHSDSILSAGSPEGSAAVDNTVEQIGTGDAAQAAEETAATKIQAVQRGRKGRKQAAVKKNRGPSHKVDEQKPAAKATTPAEAEAGAAVKIQARARGRAVRRGAQQKKQASAQEDADGARQARLSNLKQRQ